MTAPLPGDILDRNICGACGGIVVLRHSVGWVHLIMVASDYKILPRLSECETPRPHRLRCPHCRLIPAAWGQWIKPHRNNRGFTCPGSRSRGVPPLPEEAAFDPAREGG